MGQADINFTFASPVVRWQNPTRSSLVVDISVHTDVVSYRQDGNSKDLELAVVKLSGTYSVLWSGTKTAPNNGVVQPGNPVTLKNISVGPGDALLFTHRNKLDTPLGGSGATAWFDAATITCIVPALKITQSGSNAVLSWPASFTGFALQQNSDLTTTNWMDATNAVNPAGQENQVLLTFSELSGKSFYRLKRQPPLNVSRMPVPPRVWGTWNDFADPINFSWANSTNVNEAYIHTLCDWWATNGMRAAGWKYIVLEENWQTGLDANGRFLVNTNANKFPSGLTNLCTYIKSKGFIPGIYTSVSANHGGITCEGFAGTCYTNLDKHFQQFADWGFAFVFCDVCSGYYPWTDVPNNLMNGLDAQYLQRINLINEAINKTGKSMSWLDVTPPGSQNGFWSPLGYGQQNITFTFPEGGDRWDFIPGNVTQAEIVERTATNSVNGWYQYTQPGHYFYQGLLSFQLWEANYKLSFCLQAMTCGAMFIDSGLPHIFSTPTDHTLTNTYPYLGPYAWPPSTWDGPASLGFYKTNQEIAAIHQDPAVVPAQRVWSNGLSTIWSRPLGRKELPSDYALLLINASTTNQAIAVPFTLFAPTNSYFAFRDVVAQTNCPTATNTAIFTVTPTNCMMFRLSPPAATVTASPIATKNAKAVLGF